MEVFSLKNFHYRSITFKFDASWFGKKSPRHPAACEGKHGCRASRRSAGLRNRYCDNTGQNRLPRLRFECLFAGRIFEDAYLADTPAQCTMKHTTLKQLGCLLLATALLVGAGGCGGVNRSLSRDVPVRFEIDDVQYNLTCFIYRDRQGLHTTSFMVCLDPASHTSPSYFSDFSRNTPKIEMKFLEGKNSVVKPETFYYIKDDEIVFEKNYQEMQLDASRLLVGEDNKLALDYLVPILIPLIRENVPPQATEMEEKR